MATCARSAAVTGCPADVRPVYREGGDHTNTIDTTLMNGLHGIDWMWGWGTVGIHQPVRLPEPTRTTGSSPFTPPGTENDCHPHSSGAGLNGSVTVHIQDTDPSASIYYTTNGSLPTLASPLYTQPLSFNQTTTLKAMAYRPGLNQSATVTAVYTQTGGDGQPPIQNPVTYAPTDLSRVQVYPNPWRADKHLSHPQITFANLPSGAIVKIFSTSGRKVKSLNEANNRAIWDLINDHGDKVAGGIYMYLITAGQTGYYGAVDQKVKGKVAVIR